MKVVASYSDYKITTSHQTGSVDLQDQSDTDRNTLPETDYSDNDETISIIGMLLLGLFGLFGITQKKENK